MRTRLTSGAPPFNDICNIHPHCHKLPTSCTSPANVFVEEMSCESEATFLRRQMIGRQDAAPHLALLLSLCADASSTSHARGSTAFILHKHGTRTDHTIAPRSE
jgi:hypothetical protein